MPSGTTLSRFLDFPFREAYIPKVCHTKKFYFTLTYLKKIKNESVFMKRPLN